MGQGCWAKGWSMYNYLNGKETVLAARIALCPQALLMSTSYTARDVIAWRLSKRTVDVTDKWHFHMTAYVSSGESWARSRSNVAAELRVTACWKNSSNGSLQLSRLTARTEILLSVSTFVPSEKRCQPQIIPVSGLTDEHNAEAVLTIEALFIFDLHCSHCIKHIYKLQTGTEPQYYQRCCETLHGSRSTRLSVSDLRIQSIFKMLFSFFF